jgi:hypothetical protein
MPGAGPRKRKDGTWSSTKHAPLAGQLGPCGRNLVQDRPQKPVLGGSSGRTRDKKTTSEHVEDIDKMVSNDPS